MKINFERSVASVYFSCIDKRREKMAAGMIRVRQKAISSFKMDKTAAEAKIIDEVSGNGSAGSSMRCE